MRQKTIKDAWWIRTKPRSIFKAVEWYKDFGILEGENWELKSNKISCKTKKKIYPVRRKYIYTAHNEELIDVYPSYNKYLSGAFDKNETESNGRNDKSTFEFYGFGYVDKTGVIRNTKAGKMILDGRFTSETLLRQVLKLQFGSPIIKEKFKKLVFPMEVLLNLFKEFDELNRFELTFVFFCVDIGEINKTVKGIKQFRKRYNELDNKAKQIEVIKILTEEIETAYGSISNKLETYYKEYSDALIRMLEYTGIFASRGRGYYTKVYVPKFAQKKVELLQEQFEFKPNLEKNLEKYMEIYGDPFAIKLPWENIKERKTLLNDKVDLLKSSIKVFNDDNIQTKFEFDDLIKKVNYINKTEDIEKLDEELSTQIIELNEKIFIEKFSKEYKYRKEIIDRFNSILKGTEDMAALWLECNTWKSLVAINGQQTVKRNFTMELDLTPRAFAPGVGNTPDMELYFENYIVLPEVSLMTGVRQWEHEASSVVDHVFRFIKEYENKKVIGLFISSKINIRSLWQFFILNKESWIGKPIPVIPITIEQYIKIITKFYTENLNITELLNLLESLKNYALNLDNYETWNQKIEKKINDCYNKR